MPGSAGKLVTILGGSGFVGRHVSRELARRGWRIRVACRHPQLAVHLQPLGNVGEVVAVAADVRDAHSLRRVIDGADAVVDLVGILVQSGGSSFRLIHAEGARRAAEAAKICGIERFVQVSAIGADAASPAEYARTKAQAEQVILATRPQAVILRPSIIFGEEDEFFNRFARMARVSPLLPAVGFGRTRFQPVYVGDVARAVASAVEGEARAGTIYELGGPKVCTFAELLCLTQRWSGRREALMPLPFWLASIQGFVLQYLPGKILTLDQVRNLRRDNVVSQAAEQEGRTLEGLGITPAAIETIVPAYLEKYRPGGMYNRYRKQF